MVLREKKEGRFRRPVFQAIFTVPSSRSLLRAVCSAPTARSPCKLAKDTARECFSKVRKIVPRFQQTHWLLQPTSKKLTCGARAVAAAEPQALSRIVGEARVEQLALSWCFGRDRERDSRSERVSGEIKDGGTKSGMQLLSSIGFFFRKKKKRPTATCFD